MTFILLTGSIMAVSLFLIHHLCRFIGIEMKWVSLVLCAVMALLINAVAISMSPFLTRMHYLRLGVLVLVASAFVTLFNERLLRREERAASAAKEAPQSWADGQPVIAAEACPAAVSEQDIQQELPADDAGEIPVQPASEAQPEKRPETEPETSEITKTAESAEKAGTPRQDKAAEPAEPSKSAESAEPESPAAVQHKEEAEKAAEARAESKAKELAKAKALAKEKARQAEARQAAENEARRRAAEERKARQEAEKKAKEAALQKAREEEAAAKAREAALQKAREEEAAAKAKEAAQQKAREEKAAAVRQEVAAMDSLDSILDYAYDHAESSPETAICAYQQAIARYPDDSYTPFLVIELGNLYKGQAAYQKAAEAYRQALSLPIIAANDAMKQEFIKNTRYLVTVQNILSKHHALSTPFPDIPADIMQEIETEFQKSS